MPTIQRYHQYQLLKREDGSLWELGRGAMGITYKAFDTNLRFPVAIKVINSTYLENDTAKQRFLREARAAAALRHPNVASVFNLGTEEDKYFYVMEFIDGETVEARVRRQGSLEPVVALNIGLQVARALAVAAKHQLVHRDLKPTNLMLVDQEGEQLVKVIDFGLAKVSKDSGEDSGALTVAGFVGTPHFASPEQIEEGEVDIRSDIYSLGVTLYFALTGQSPFSGSIGQVMSQQLYKPLPLGPLAHQPPCVVSLLQHMMEKDPGKRPQTAQDLQKAMLACIEELRHQSFSGISATSDAAAAFETLDLTTASRQPPGVGAVLAQNYKLLEELAESPQGRNFLADDLRRNRRVNVLLLSPEFLSDRKRFTNLETAVRLACNSPHPLLRQVYSLETVTDSTFLVQEHVTGPSMLDILRARSVLTAPEVVQLVSLLAPLADHADRYRLQHIDLTLLGIHLKERISSATGTQTDLLRRPLTAWEPLQAKVDAINFSFSPSHTETWVSPATLTPGASAGGPPGSCVRLLSLLAYELLGGPRARLDSTGLYTPVALLNREGNAVLRRGVVDELPSADELAKQLAAVVVFKRPGSTTSESARRVIPERLPEALPEAVAPTPQPEAVAGTPQRPPPRRIGWRFVLVIGFILLAGIGAFLLFWHPQPQEIAALSIFSEPAGASILLDGKPPQAPSNTFTHVPFGSHQITANLSDYEPIRQEIQVYPGMVPKIRLQLRSTQEIDALSVLTEPPGAQILLDGKPPQKPPNTFTRVPFGTHQITATLDDFEPLKQEIQVRRSMAPQIRLQLRPTPEIAALSVLSEPAGAEILLDGKPPQIPPNTFTHVPLGSHQITATLDDFEPIKQEVQVHPGMAHEIRLQLKPTQEIAALSVLSEPAGAEILLDGKPPQAPPNTFTHVPFGSHQITATLDDFEPLKQEVQVHRGMAREIRLQLKPTQEIAALSILSQPAGAEILLDGKPPQAPPNTFTHVPFGSHQITATLDDFEPIKQEVQVHRAMAREIRLQLKPIQEIAALSVLSEPAGAEILLDGKPPQAPPNTFTHVPFGSHQITATLDDFEPLKQEVQVYRGMAREIRLQLKPTQGIPALSVLTEPAGAEILLDGKPPQAPPNTFTHVPFGSHQITATLDDFEPIRQEVQVRRGMAREIRLQLKPTQEIAALSVLSEPAGAEILLDGKPPQAPPNTFTHVPFGSHQITATLDDFEPIKQDIQVHRGMAREIRLQLKPTQEIAALSVLSEPAGAEILLDGKPPQALPNTFTHVPFGSHQITATLDDFEPIRQEIQVHRGMPREIRLQLKPTQEIAALSVLSEPAGAEILLDGKPPQTPPNTFTHVPFGSHQITAALSDFEPIKQEIQVHRGMDREIRLQLKPTQEIAALSILSEPAGAEVLLDGKPPQAPPNTFTHVPFGSHQISATLKGYGTIHQDIEVRRGMAPEVHLQLTADQFALLLNQVKKYPEDSPEHLTALVHLVQLSNSSSASNAAEYTKELGSLLERLRTRVPPISKNEFSLLYKDGVKDAASLDLVPAIVWLAENEKLSRSSDLFLRAAKLGDSYAMMKLGRLYLRKWTGADDAEGFRWLNQAYTAPKPNLEAGAYIADCYLSGKGTTQDVQKAEEVVMPLANQGIVPAMTLAGRIFTIKADRKRAEAEANTNAQQRRLEAQANDLDRQARRWWERAAEKDDWNAAAHLGKCYEEGWGGVEKNEAEAERRYKAGASHGNALSLFFYGLFLEKKPERKSEAPKLIVQAAEMSLPSAMKWCRDNNVPFQESKGEDDR